MKNINSKEAEIVGTESQPIWVKPQLIQVNEKSADGKNTLAFETTIPTWGIMGPS